MFYADLHIHSRYSRATSRDCDLPHLDLWARKKGIALVGTGDFTHPAWRQELQEQLLPAEEGLYRLKEAYRLPWDSAWPQGEPRFLVTGEISSIYKQGGKTRKVHNVLLLPSLEAAEKLALRLERIGNLQADGRPIWGFPLTTCWSSPWRPAPRRCSSPPTSGRPTSPCLGPSPGSTPWRNALGTWPPASAPWRRASPRTRP